MFLMLEDGGGRGVFRQCDDVAVVVGRCGREYGEVADAHRGGGAAHPAAVPQGGRGFTSPCGKTPLPILPKNPRFLVKFHLLFIFYSGITQFCTVLLLVGTKFGTIPFSCS
jgi:hypothetical protein